MSDKPSDEDERRWLAAWRGSDEAQGRLLYDRYAPSVTRFFEMKLSQRDEVQDLVQKTFIELRRTQTEIEHSVRAFIFGVANNVLRHKLRELRRAREREGRMQLAPAGGAVVVADIDPVDPEACFGEKVEHRLVGKALRRLPLDDQVALELSFWEELPRVEIAAVFGVPEGTMANRLAAARRRLAAKIAELATSAALLESTSKTFGTWLEELHEHVDALKLRTPRRPRKDPGSER